MSKNRRIRKEKGKEDELKELRRVVRSYNIDPGLVRFAAVLRVGINYVVVGDRRNGLVYCFGSLPVGEAKIEEEKAVNEWDFCPTCKRFWKPALNSFPEKKGLGGEKKKHG